MNKKHKIIVAITGASGSIYAKVLLDSLLQYKDQVEAVGVVMTNNAKQVWQTELENDDYTKYPFTFYDKNDFNAPFASGSAKYTIMIVCPCSMGMLGRIASGVSDDLTTRAADVILKEKRKLILAIRETPYNLIHIKNMETITLAGGIICPATPSFYSLPKTFDDLAKTVTDRILMLAGIETKGYEWGE
ncbi:MAG: UbiX family flavin prenyltransferase [Chitinophagaceae bacterium]